MNIRIDYLYRDAANYKRFGFAVLGNPDGVPMDVILLRLEEATLKTRLFHEVIHFRPQDAGLPTLFFEDVGYAHSEDDLNLHEVLRLTKTDEVVTAPITIDQVLSRLASACAS